MNNNEEHAWAFLLTLFKQSRIYFNSILLQLVKRALDSWSLNVMENWNANAASTTHPFLFDCCKLNLHPYSTMPPILHYDGSVAEIMLPVTTCFPQFSKTCASEAMNLRGASLLSLIVVDPVRVSNDTHISSSQHENRGNPLFWYPIPTHQDKSYPSNYIFQWKMVHSPFIKYHEYCTTDNNNATISILHN